ncbi:hypothetical protein BJY52DRAFT_1192713 [Lactarius psammicola]|nr:hypothetical protein BJY52DRAFT_1192713 [Lactarius psammicola]
MSGSTLCSTPIVDVGMHSAATRGSHGNLLYTPSIAPAQNPRKGLQALGEARRPLGARPDAMSLRTLQVSELQTWINGNRLTLQMSKRKNVQAGERLINVTPPY